uniref:DUF4939 domain-containing protein n=1 Tax=Neolamprologus brichardi TaxID=32507 RepID=A0A3Q4MEM9_NEOBR
MEKKEKSGRWKSKAMRRVRQREESHLPTPELFSGDVGKCAGFLMQCSLQFRQRPHAFSNDGSKISYFVQLLRDHALTWAQAVLSASPGITYDEFLSLFRSVFDKGWPEQKISTSCSELCYTVTWILEKVNV